MRAVDYRRSWYEHYMTYRDEPHRVLLSHMPKRWQTYAIECITKLGIDYRVAIRDTYIYGVRDQLWVHKKIGDEHYYYTVKVRVSHRGHIYLE